jgi:predicted O-methyltransferase YrrM
MTPDGVLGDLERTAVAKGLPIIGRDRGSVLDEAVLECRPGRALEVGTLIGYSAIRIARLLQPGGLLTCIEVNPDMVAVARANLGRAGFSDRVRVLEGDAAQLIPTVEPPVDFLFIDADKAQYLTYLTLAEPKLRRGSVVVADNVKRFEKELEGYLAHVRGSGAYRSRYVEPLPTSYPDYVDAVEVSVRL